MNESLSKVLREDLASRAVAMGVAAGGMISPEIVALLPADKVESDDPEYKPPRPPRRPNARIGRTAIGYSC